MPLTQTKNGIGMADLSGETPMEEREKERETVLQRGGESVREGEIEKKRREKNERERESKEHKKQKNEFLNATCR